MLGRLPVRSSMKLRQDAYFGWDSLRDLIWG